MKIIDLRSDTVNFQTDNMLRAIFNAKLGDDVFEDDPTVNSLERISADRLGKEAALFVPSGTMANLISTLVHCNRGEEAILGDQSHMFCYEAGGTAAVGGVNPHILPNEPDGTISPDRIKAAIRQDNVHFPRTKLICLENTQNKCGGVPLTVDYMQTIRQIADANNLLIHLDGARIFNAAVALNVDVKQLTIDADSVSFCLSKGLSAPVGSLICGTKEFIYHARRNRKMLGGGMRQVGVLAAAGIVALDEMIDRLADDHKNAKRLAAGITDIDGLTVDLDTVQTNIVYFDITTDKIATDAVIENMDKKSIQFLALGPKRFRMVTHYGIDTDDIETTLTELKQVMAE